MIEEIDDGQRKTDDHTAAQALDRPRHAAGLVYVTDKHARYFGTELSEQSLVPVGEAILGEVSYRDWLAGQ